MVKFKTIVEFARYHTDSRLVLTFRSLLSIEFLFCDVGDKLPGWDMEQLEYYAEYDGMRYLWAGEGAPTEFMGPWTYMERVKV